MRRLPRLRHLTLLAALAVLTGCAAMKDAVDSVKARLPTPAPVSAAREATEHAEAPPPAAPQAAPKVAPRARSRAPAGAPPEAAEAPSAPAAAPRPAAPALPSGSPAWLARCVGVQVAGGIVRCDADGLLAKPSATVQVFTRDPKRVVRGQIALRAGLPRIYRFYVVP